MDCNKDEAIRAKELAEKKMAEEDFEGARTSALKAQKLYPQLENIAQLLSVCDVHRSAQIRIQTEKDWYGILQVGRFADESVIKKQYRRMALLLHPDKNRLPGAEAAFKLVSEAYAFLSDSANKFKFDSKIRGPAIPKPQPQSHHVNMSFNSNQRSGSQNNVTTGFWNDYKSDLYWCPGCKITYKPVRARASDIIRCIKCYKPFTAFERSGPGVSSSTQPAAQVPSKPGSSQVGIQNTKGHSVSYAGSKENISTKPVQPEPDIKVGRNCEGVCVPNTSGNPNAQVSSKLDSSKVVAGKVGVQNKGHSASYAGSQENISTRPVQPGPGTKVGPNAFTKGNARFPSKPDTSKVVEGLSQGFSKVGAQNSKEYSASQAGTTIGRNHEGIHIASAYNGNEDLKANGTSSKDTEKEPRDLKKNKKRDRENLRDSRENFAYSDDSDFETATNKVNPGNFETGISSKGRSSRRKQNIEANDDDLVLSERLKEREKLGIQKNFPANANCSKLKNKEKCTTRVEESLQGKHATLEKRERVGGEINPGPGNGTKSADVESASDVEFDSEVSDLESDSGDGVAGETSECADTEFYDFEKERDGVPFQAGQVWACYDDFDSMPRFYAKVTKAISSPFEVSFRWLEADPTNEAHGDWSVGCGTYKPSRTIERTSSRNIFSHPMNNCLPGKKRGSLVIHPKKGEIWLLFKKSSPEDGKGLKYQVVEVLSDFADGAGIEVCWLDKISGRVSVFQKAGQVESFMIGPDELHRFSHRVPSYKLLGCPGVPTGCFELDPASLPSNPDDLHFPGKAKKESRRMDCKPPKAADDNVPAKSTRRNSVIDLD